MSEAGFWKICAVHSQTWRHAKCQICPSKLHQADCIFISLIVTKLTNAKVK